MLYYYIRMAVFSLKRTPLLSFLMIATISIGIAATMVTYTVSYMMTKDPIPSKSERLFTVHLSSWDPSRMYKMEDGKEQIPIWVTYQDAMNLYNEKKGKRQTIIGSHKTMSRAPSQPPSGALSTLLRATTYEFFDMFEVPFLYGSGWTESDDEQGARVVVLSKKRNMKLFNGRNSVGEEVLIGGLLYRVVGVLDDWVVLPRFYLESHDVFMDVRDMFIPFRSNIDNEWIAASDVSMYCWGDFEMNKFSSMLTSECVWLYFWVELEASTQRDAYFDFVNNYAMEQRALGRFQREQMNRVLNVPEFIKHNKVVTGDSRLAVWLALAFLIACLLNCMSLMMTKFHGKGAEIGLRRAVGASKEDIAWQFGCETILIGLLGGVVGLLLANLGLIITAEIYSHLNPALMAMNIELMLTTLVSSVIASSLFGLYPIYRACQIQPSSQLKSL
ncbi:ABC transporter permease [Pseudoalteromonas sp. Of7M-16]|uniref:ABC transporter permease n=1 Tax=Pseudoalteromonas sp. Of7M-16 TaxID=2917756 RepID=UPI001EF67042|nr:ABC transporter permease [Pseudoalteromonas sp. Of7M-16]MCG7548416.1 ABC transporter permease [Pseudoalteromonas sp. Of7M-16]